MNKSQKILFLLLAFLSVLVNVQPINAERPPFKIYTTEEGLAHDSVNKIVRDSRGFLWFCTAEGLSRFDGTRFTNFTQDQGLPHRNITDFLETRDGKYLIGTSVGMVVFNPNGRAYRWNVLESRLEQTGAEPPMFQTFAPETDNRQKKYILSLAEDTNGTIWAGTSFGLFKIENIGANWRFQEFEVEKGKDVGFGALLLDSHGDLLICSGSGLYRKTSGEKFEKFAETGATSMMEDRDGKIWVGAGGNEIGLRVFQSENDQLKLVQTYKKADGLFANSFHFTLKQTSDGRIYVGQAKGLEEFLPEAKTNEPKFRVLSNDIINTLAEDSTGNLWIGTDLKGAWKLARSGFVSFGEKDGISESEDIRSIYANRNGEIFLPTRPQKILHLTSDGKFESILPFGIMARSWGWRFLDFQATDGEWWIPASGGLRRYPKVSDFADLANTPPKRIYTTADGLWSDEIF